MAILGSITGGIGSKIGKSFKVVGKLLKGGEKAEEALKSSNQIYDAYKKGEWHRIFDKVTPSKFINNTVMMKKVRNDIKIPSNWDQKITNDGKGLRFAKPDTNRADEIRIMPPNHNLHYSTAKSPSVRLKKDGKWRDIEGKIIELQSDASHVPLEGFKFPDWL